MNSIFLEFGLPNSTTWFYWSLLLSVALFFQFHRWLSLRNLDLLALYCFGPGFLLIQEAHRVALSGTGNAAPLRYTGYGLLLGFTLYWFLRCLVDLLPLRRPLPMPNLATPGLIWFAVMFSLILGWSAFARPSNPWEPIGKPPLALNLVQQHATEAVAEVSYNGVAVAKDRTRHIVETSLALMCHLAVVFGLLMICWKHLQSLPLGVATGSLYLLLPYTAYHIGEVHHVWPAALILWAIFFYRRPSCSGMLLGLASGTAFFPVLLLPVWVQFYRRHGLKQFSLSYLVSLAFCLGCVIWLLSRAGYNTGDFWFTAYLSDWQPWRTPTAESIWTGAHWAYRIPVFILFVGYVLTMFVWPPVKNLGHLIAMSAGVLMGIQFWFADRGGLYLLWYQPLLILVAFRTSLSECVPEPTPGDQNSLAWVRQKNKSLNNSDLTSKPPSLNSMI